jgi:putative transposase
MTQKSLQKNNPDEKKSLQRVSFSLKKEIVQKIIDGELSIRYAAEKYDIPRATIDYWVRTMSTFGQKQYYMAKKDEIKRLKERIEELELLKDFQQDFIAELETEVGKDLARTVSQRNSSKEKKAIQIAQICRLFGLSRQAWYARIKTDIKCNIVEEQVIDLVKQRRKELKRSGSIKIYDLIKPELVNRNIKYGRDKLHALLKQHNMLIKRKKNYITTTQSNHRFKKHPNLIKDLDICQAEQVWVSDITYIKTHQKPLYLSLVTDAYSKKIMGFNLADNLRAESSLEAVKMAIQNRKFTNRTLTHHSDRGFQYCSDMYTKHLNDHQIHISMTQQYDPYENAIAERVNGILKQEFDIDCGFVSQKQAYKEIKHAIKLYNTISHVICKHPKKPMKTGISNLKDGEKLKLKAI